MSCLSAECWSAQTPTAWPRRTLASCSDRLSCAQSGTTVTWRSTWFTRTKRWSSSFTNLTTSLGKEACPDLELEKRSSRQDLGTSRVAFVLLGNKRRMQDRVANSDIRPSHKLQKLRLAALHVHNCKCVGPRGFFFFFFYNPNGHLQVTFSWPFWFSDIWGNIKSHNWVKSHPSSLNLCVIYQCWKGIFPHHSSETTQNHVTVKARAPQGWEHPTISGEEDQSMCPTMTFILFEDAVQQKTAK